MNDNIYKVIDWNEDSWMILEQKKENKFLARVFSISVSFEDFNFGIYHTENSTGYNQVTAGDHEDWRILPFKDFINRRKSIGNELQGKINMLFEMIKSEEFQCYEGAQYIIHVPKYRFRIAGPKYAFSTDAELSAGQNYSQYFLKTTDEDYKLKEVLNSEYLKMSEDAFFKIIRLWNPFLELLLSDNSTPL